MVALSVSMSASTSPAETLSPFFFFQDTSVPSVMVSLSFGMVISGMGNLPLGVTNLVHCSDQLVHAGQHRLLEAFIVRHGHVLLRYTENRRIQLIKNVLLNAVT